jgi:GAF domain-containing protein
LATSSYAKKGLIDTSRCMERLQSLLNYDGHNPVLFPGPNSSLTHLAASKQVQTIADMRTTPGYLDNDPAAVQITDVVGARTLVVVPILKGNELVGAIGIHRDEVRPFSEKQIGLVKSFADQAVIAIENARLFEAEQARTHTPDKRAGGSARIPDRNQRRAQRHQPVGPRTAKGT